MMDELVRASLQQTTLNSYSNVLRNVHRFLSDKLNVPSLLPLNVSVTGLYVTHLYQLGLQASTIRTHLSAISFAHKMRDLKDPTQTFYIKKLVSAIDKAKPSSDSRVPITFSILQGLVEAVQVCASSPFESALFSAMMLFAYYACLRVGEIAASAGVKNTIQASQITGIGRPGMIKAYRIKFENYKHSDGSNPSIQINADPALRFCPVAFLTTYLKFRGDKPGALFLSPKQTPVTRLKFLQVLHQSLTYLDIPKQHFNTHSFRIGRCTDLALEGYSVEQLKLAGRWKSNAFMGYIRPKVFII